MSSSNPASRTHAEIGAIVSRVQSRFIRGAQPADVFEPLLSDLLAFTDSEYGFIAGLQHDPQCDAPWWHMLAVNDVNWDAGSRALATRHRGKQCLASQLGASLMSAVVTSGQAVIGNGPGLESRRSGLPLHRAGADAFVGVPLFHGKEMVGVVGLGHRECGYDPSLLDFLQLLFASVGALIGAARLDAERREAERALDESKQRLRATFDMAAVGLAHIAPDGRFQHVNQRLCDILGYSCEQLVGMRFHDVTVPEDVQGNVAQLQRLLDGQAESFKLEKRYRHAQGDVVWAALTVTLVRDAAGAPDYFLAVIEDITARKQAQAAVMAAQAAERANAAKTEFLSRMSHELRTPLNAVLGFTQLLQMDSTQPLSAEQHAKLQHIENAGAHLLAMINDVLDLSRIESGTMPLSAETVRLTTTAQEAIALVATAAREANVRIQVESPPAHATLGNHVHADHLRLRQVLINLLSNAIKYNRKGGSVTLRWAADEDGGTVRLQVIDTGLGLTREQREHLFEPFNRLGAERRNIEGTGIGLVVTQRLVQLMRGSIHVESEPGVGSCFTVTLPSAQDGQATPGERDPSQSRATPATKGRPRTVLYAEDNPINVELVREVIRLRKNCRLLVAHSGREAIDLASSQRPDLLLLDMHLGDMTGMQVMKTLAQDPSLAGVPAVALSADAMAEPIAAAKRAGFKAYLTKPLNVGQLLRCVDEALGTA